MYERFTDTARKSFQCANQVAERYRHEYIGTEHILLGIVEEGSGVAVTVLRTLNVDLEKIPLEVEKVVQHGPEPATIGKLPQTPRAKKIIEYAMEEARDLNHNYVGTEHLLLGLIRETHGVAGQVLHKLGVRIEDVRLDVVKLNVREPETGGLGIETRWPSRFGARGFGRFAGRVVRSFGLGSESGNRSAGVPSDPEALEREIERLNLAKEDAIAHQDFERAARLRDEADLLKRRKTR
jgi:ATP-dependent Clp protease ATP-binding subunit ClpA